MQPYYLTLYVLLTVYNIAALWLLMPYAQPAVIKQLMVVGWNQHGLMIPLARHIVRPITWLLLLSGTSMSSAFE